MQRTFALASGMSVTDIGFAPRFSSSSFGKSKLKPPNFSPQWAWHRALPQAFNR
jgi:hypothetical protein